MLQLHKSSVGIWIFTLLILSSCKSIKMAPNGYAVQGDEYVMNADYKMAVYLGESIMMDQNWQRHKPVQVRKVTSPFRKLLKSLHYPDTAYHVLFTAQFDVPVAYKMTALINKNGNAKGKPASLIDLSAFQRVDSREGKYFFQELTLHNQRVLHYVLPISQKLWQEKYLSLIFEIPNQPEARPAVEDLVLSNLSSINHKNKFTPSRTEILCPDEKDRSFLDYRIPDNKIDQKHFMLMKAYGVVNGVRTLIVYRLLTPGNYYGSFVVCKGSYEIEYSTLSGRLKWKTTYQAL